MWTIVSAYSGDLLARDVPRLRVLVMPAHDRIRLHLALPPRGDDPALHRRMRGGDETVGRSEVREQAFHKYEPRERATSHAALQSSSSAVRPATTPCQA